MPLTKVKVNISSCGYGESFYNRELKRLALLSSKTETIFIDSPEDADIILIVDIDENNLFQGLRNNPIWKKYPDKSFGIYEGDHAPIFLHGLYSDARQSPMNINRFLGLPYKMHQICFPNLTPDVSLVQSTPKDLLFSFAGRMSHKIRKKLLTNTYPSGEVELIDTSAYNHFQVENSYRDKFQETYWELAMRSKYVLCPRGAAASSVRLFEIMEAGIAPVIISDDWIPPYGPNWQEFTLIIPEKNISNIFEIVKSHEDEWLSRSQKARLTWEEYFSDQKYWDFCLESIEYINQTQYIKESLFRKIFWLLYIQKNVSITYMKSVLFLKKQIKKNINLT